VRLLGRDRSSLLAVNGVPAPPRGTPLGQAKLAREAGLANNTVAQGYVSLLSDLMCIASSFAWDPSRKVRVRRSPASTISATPWRRWPGIPPWSGRRGLRAVACGGQGAWYEWAVAQELWRRAAIRGEELPEEMATGRAPNTKRTSCWTPATSWKSRWGRRPRWSSPGSAEPSPCRPDRCQPGQVPDSEAERRHPRGVPAGRGRGRGSVSARLVTGER